MHAKTPQALSKPRGQIAGSRGPKGKAAGGLVGLLVEPPQAASPLTADGLK